MSIHQTQTLHVTGAVRAVNCPAVMTVPDSVRAAIYSRRYGVDADRSVIFAEFSRVLEGSFFVLKCDIFLLDLALRV